MKKALTDFSPTFYTGIIFSTWFYLCWSRDIKTAFSRVAAYYLRKVNGPCRRFTDVKLLRVVVVRALFVDDNPDRFKLPEADRAREETRGGYAVSSVSGSSHGQSYAHRPFADSAECSDPRSRSGKYDAMSRINGCRLQPLSDGPRNIRSLAESQEDLLRGEHSSGGHQLSDKGLCE